MNNMNANKINDDTLKHAIEYISNSDNIKNILSIVNSMNISNNDTENECISNKMQTRTSSSHRNEPKIENNVELLTKISQIANKLNTNSEARLNLLNSLSPYLNEKRQKKLAACIQLLNLSSLLPILTQIMNNEENQL